MLRSPQTSCSRCWSRDATLAIPDRELALGPRESVRASRGLADSIGLRLRANFRREASGLLQTSGVRRQVNFRRQVSGVGNSLRRQVSGVG